MNPTRAFLVLLVAATATLHARAQSAQSRIGLQKDAAQARYSLDLETHFFRHATGKFDTEEATEMGGWNVFLGSETLLVLVTIQGLAFPIGGAPSLDLRARSGRQMLGHKWVSLRKAYFSESGRATIPFLIYGAGACNPIEVTAVLQIRGRRQKVRREIRLACGE
jgi:hypothetical protein